MMMMMMMMIIIIIIIIIEFILAFVPADLHRVALRY
jgi:hypothetical protein